MSVTLDQVRFEANSYPTDVLDGCETALLLFGGGFRGRNDGIWFADAGIDCTCVDVDPTGLDEMEQMYPGSWRFRCTDAFSFAERAAQAGDRWDVVSVDCPTDLFGACAVSAPLWCSLAEKAVVLGCGTETAIAAPDGWAEGECLHRSDFNGGVYWQVLVREPTR